MSKTWFSRDGRTRRRSDVIAGLTVGAMLVPQAMAYAQLGGLPPQVGLYAATLPLLVYMLIGTSRQLAVGPVALVSLLTATAIEPLADQDTATYLQLAAALALIVGAIYVVAGVFKLGSAVNLLSHAVLVGFTAGAALIIGVSQAKYVLGVPIPRGEFADNLADTWRAIPEANGATVLVAAVAILVMIAIKRWLPSVPSSLVVVIGSIAAVRLFHLADHGVAVVGDIPAGLPPLGVPSIGGSQVIDLLPSAVVIVIIGLMESFAVAKVYARRHRYDIDANREALGIGAANIAAGITGAYPVAGGFARTAVNDSSGAQTQWAALTAALTVGASTFFLTPLFASLPQAALGAIILVAVYNLIDVDEIRHIASVKRSDIIPMATAFFGSLAFGIEVGIGVAVIVSMLVVFARMSRPHTAVLGRVPDTTTYRNISRFPEVECFDGVHIVRIDAAISFANAHAIRGLLIEHAEQLGGGGVLILDASGINDVDTSGISMLGDTLGDLAQTGVSMHLSSVKGPVRDVLKRAGLWDGEFAGRLHASTDDAVMAVLAHCPSQANQRRFGVDERTGEHDEALRTQLNGRKAS